MSDYESELRMERLRKAAENKARVAAANPETMYWALYRLLDAIYSARAEDPQVRGPDRRGGLFNIVYFTADHWGPLVPGMPNAEDIRKEIAADVAYHELTYWAESRGLRVTGDEFI